MISGIILCGGRSTRMGRDKASVAFGDETMLDRITRIVGTVADELIVVGRRDQEVSTVHDRVEDEGPLEGIATGLAASKTDLNIVVACDMPLISPAVLHALIDAIGDHEACVGVIEDQVRPFPGIYRAELKDAAASLLASGERRVTALLAKSRLRAISSDELRRVDPDLDTYTGCNTPDELRAALLRSR